MEKDIYFGKSKLERELVAAGIKEDNVHSVIVEDLKARGMRMKYSRMWEDEDGEMTIDFGSWSLFYFLKES